MVTNKAVFVFNSFKKLTPDDMSLFEVELLQRLAESCNNGPEGWGVPIEGIVSRRAAHLLVRRDLASYVKNNLFPSPEFLEDFHPALEGDSTMEAVTDQYDVFVQEETDQV